MPLRTVTGLLVAVDHHAELVLPGDTGILHAATLNYTHDGTPLYFREPAAYFGAIYLISLDTTQPRPFILLAQGRFGSFTAVSWTGRIQRDPSFALMANVEGFANTPFTLSALVEL
jgi:hypothetical protein